MVIVAVEAVPVGSKPPAAVRVRISAGERHGFGASIRASSLELRRAGGPVESLLKGRDRPRQKRYPHLSLVLLQRPPYAYESSCLRVHFPPWEDVAAELLAPGLLNTDFISLVFSISSPS